jgi:hypothetical protein
VADFSELPLRYRLEMAVYRWRRLDPVPWTAPAVPPQRAKVALVTTGGLYRPQVDEPFRRIRGGDYSFRVVPDDVELGALAGAGLVALRMGAVEDAREVLDDVEARMQARPDWFQGRELAEALRVRIAAVDSTNRAVAMFYRALALAETADFYGAAWLIAECADILDAHDRALLRSSVNRFAPQGESQGYHGMSRRYSELLSRK